jgi:hypothetical protein
MIANKTTRSRNDLRGSGSATTPEDFAALLLATAPQAYDARNTFSNVQVVGPVKDQGDCGMW